MAIDFDMMSVVAYCLPDAKHNKKDFDRDFNRFIVKQDMLSIATNKAQAEGRLDEFLSYVDNQVAVDVVRGCDDKSRLSVAIENAYLAESVRAKLYGNESFGDVAHAVYEKFEGKIIPEEFVGSAQYVNNFIKGSFGENNLVYALSDKISEKEVADGYLLDTEGLSDWELDTYPIYDVVDAYRLGAYERFSSEREEHIDLISYANDLDAFESKFDCRKYAGDVVKSRLRSVLESSFEREFVQASSRVYFNKNLNGGNLNLLKDATTYFMDNKPLFDKVADTHVADGMMRDKLTDVAKLHLWIYNYELDCHLIVPDYEEMMDDNLIYYTPSKMADDVDYYRLMQDSAMFHDWQRRLDESSRKVLNLPSEPEDESEKEF